VQRTVPDMPEVIFTIQLPDGTLKECYSPSTVVCRYFQPGDEMSVADFLNRSRTALGAAAERVRAKFGFSCSSAAEQMARIEEWASTQPAEARVRVISV
jgi:uncharacterized repeat protein (TIGR04042 family)